MTNISNKANTADLAIIGGGSVGVSFLAQLIKYQTRKMDSAPTATSVLLFEPNRNPGAGKAYGADLNTNLLNIPVRSMTAFADDKSHFHRWLTALPDSMLSEYGVQGFDQDAFLPRPLFGRYMESVYRESLREAKALGIEVLHVQSVAQSAEKNPNGGWIMDAGGRRYAAKRLVLCNGNLPSSAFPQLQDLPNFFNSPYPVSRLVGRIDRKATVGIIGSSLSAIDAIVALKEGGHTGPIVCCSRNGRLPSVRSRHNRANPAAALTEKDIRDLARKNAGKVSLEQFAFLMRSRIAALGGHADVDDILGCALPANEALDREIEMSQQRERPWQVVCSASNGIIDLAWHLLPDSERRTYQKHWRSLWMARRAMFPLQNALKLQSYFNGGALQVVAGFEECRHDPDSHNFILRRQALAGGVDASHHAKYVINASSFSLDASATTDPLLSGLIQHGHAVPHPYGGLRLDYETGSLIDIHGEPQHDISLLGSLAAGTYFWTISMDVNARLALRLARRISQTGLPS